MRQTLIRQYYSSPADVKLDHTPQDVDTMTKNLLMDSSPEDLSNILFGDGDSLAVENIVLPARPETPEVPPGYPMDGGYSRTFALVSSGQDSSFSRRV